MYSFDIDSPRTFLKIGENEIDINADIPVNVEVENGILKLVGLKTGINCKPQTEISGKLPGLKYSEKANCEIKPIPSELDFFKNAVHSLIFNFQKLVDDRPIFQTLKDSSDCYDYYEINLKVRNTDSLDIRWILRLTFDTFIGLVFWFGLNFITVVNYARNKILN